MAKRTGRNLKKIRKVKDQSTKAGAPPVSGSRLVFLPDHLDQVRAIAMRGLSDDEMAAVFGIDPGLIESWRQFYPSFDEAIQEGRTNADANVVAALYQNAVGYERDVDEVVKTRRGAEVVTVKKFYPGETNAQKYWLNNRQPTNWGDKVQLGGDRSKGAKPIGVRQETKDEVIASILNLISPSDAS